MCCETVVSRCFFLRLYDTCLMCLQASSFKLKLQEARTQRAPHCGRSDASDLGGRLRTRARGFSVGLRVRVTLALASPRLKICWAQSGSPRIRRRRAHELLRTANRQTSRSSAAARCDFGNLRPVRAGCLGVAECVQKCAGISAEAL